MVIQLERSVSMTSAISSSPIKGGEKGMKLFWPTVIRYPNEIGNADMGLVVSEELLI